MQKTILLTGWDVFLVDLVGGVAGGEAWGLLGIGIEYRSRTWWQMSSKKTENSIIIIFQPFIEKVL